jgi:hypothetical protein
MQFSFHAASPETFGYTLINTASTCRLLSEASKDDQGVSYWSFKISYTYFRLRLQKIPQNITTIMNKTLSSAFYVFGLEVCHSPMSASEGSSQRRSSFWMVTENLEQVSWIRHSKNMGLPVTSIIFCKFHDLAKYLTPSSCLNSFHNPNKYSQLVS